MFLYDISICTLYSATCPHIGKKVMKCNWIPKECVMLGIKEIGFT